MDAEDQRRSDALEKCDKWVFRECATGGVTRKAGSGKGGIKESGERTKSLPDSGLAGSSLPITREHNSPHQIGLLICTRRVMTRLPLVSVRVQDPHSLHAPRFSHSYLYFRPWKPSPNDLRNGRVSSRR